MTAVPFDVNDDDLRESFLRRVMFDALTDLTEDTLSLWGTMTPQQMIEHLRWAFQCSTGIIELPCYTPGNMLERAKRFLYDNRQTPHQFKNPAIGENMPPLHFFYLGRRKGGFAERNHPLLRSFSRSAGCDPCTSDIWTTRGTRVATIYFKHCYHHYVSLGSSTSAERLPYEEHTDTARCERRITTVATVDVIRQHARLGESRVWRLSGVTEVLRGLVQIACDLQVHPELG